MLSEMNLSGQNLVRRLRIAVFYCEEECNQYTC